MRISRVSDVGSGQRSQTESTRKEPCPASRAWREKALPRKLFRVDRNGLRGLLRRVRPRRVREQREIPRNNIL